MTSSQQPIAPDDLAELHVDQQLCLALQTSSSLITRLYRRLLTPLGLTHPQYLVLIALWEFDRPMTMGDLGDRISMETGSLTPLVKRMEAAGLVTRKRDEHDERRVWVEATAKGNGLRHEILRVRREVVHQLPVTSEQIAALRRLLQDMNEALT
ncbi:MarR family winged helix-turn-helix transcriptional regulator [Brevundimonas fontaquae]|uniref:MarR family transcriptional regulator n=1 Tax=Brevundimonas fontaquae TaxID=2813778 RepID=A0ABX7LN77_9CAUL|nr:MarR family transcriptional regulator [Brevundimonas fontaquae]QSF54266.1 MarR family transcriptional regulator [Brevundimonas fontaquae]